VPAGPSRPIPPGLARLCDASPLQEAEPSHLLVYLAAVPDPRGVPWAAAIRLGFPHAAQVIQVTRKRPSASRTPAPFVSSVA
jgi:hypothetical protein